MKKRRQHLIFKEAPEQMATQERLEEPVVLKENVTSKFTIEKLISLSDLNYWVFRIIHTEERIGYLGVRPNGKFKYSLTTSDFSQKQVLCFIEDYICEALGLVPTNISD